MMIPLTKEITKKIELINWVLKKMKNPDIFICEIIEIGMNEIIDKINKTDSIFKADPLDSELRILGWILYQDCSNRKKVIFKESPLFYFNKFVQIGR